MKYELAVFDLDGTLLDTLDDLMNSVNYALAMNGLKPRTRDEIRQFVGCGIRNLIMRSVPEGTPLEKTDSVFLQFQAHYAEHKADLTAPYPGILEALLKLQEKGVLLAVVSNKADEAVGPLIQRYFPDIAFGKVTGEKEGILRKPAPDMVNTVCKALGVSREKTVYIGDSETDIRTAENAGTDFIAVEWGFREKTLLEQTGGKVFAGKPSDLPRLISGA